MPMYLDNSDRERVRDATDLVQLVADHVPLQLRGREHVGLCPFHDDRTPSFAVVTHKGNAFFKCHACGAGGDCYDFVMKYHHKDFREALEFLAERAGIELTKPQRTERSAGAPGQVVPGGTAASRSDLRKACGFAADFFRKTLADDEAGRAARAAIEARGINDEMIEQFGIGAAPDQWDALFQRIARKPSAVQVAAAAQLLRSREGDGSFYDTFRNRVIFPICDESGQPVAFGGRIVDPEDSPKYLNSPESAVFHKSKTLYGLHLARKRIIDTRTVIITEGYTDVVACHQHGITNVVATLGTALTLEHAKLLSRLGDTAILVFDGDEAGQRAADRAIQAFFAEPVDIRIAVLPNGADPDDLLREPDGVEQFNDALDRAVDALAFKFDRLRGDLAGDETLSGRQKTVEGFLRELAELGLGETSGVRQQLVLQQLADMVGMPIEEIRRSMPKRSRRYAAAATTENPPPAETDIPSEMLIDDGPVITPARLTAERDLLALLVYRPDLLDIAADDEPLRSVLGPQDFVDRTSRLIADVVLATDWPEPPTVQQMMGRVEPGSAARAILAEMYIDAERICEEDGSVTVENRLRAAYDALRAETRKTQFQQTMAEYQMKRGLADDPARDAAALIEARRADHRRGQGRMAAAIGQGVRE